MPPLSIIIGPPGLGGAGIRVKKTGNATNDRIALESAIAQANAQLASKGVQPIVIPHNFAVDRPVFAFGEDMVICGEQPFTLLKCNAASPPLILGIHPTPGPQNNELPPGARPWTGDHIVDAFGILDSSICPSPGDWHGLRTYSDDPADIAWGENPAHLQPAPGADTVYAFPDSPFNTPYGASWSSLRRFRFDLCYSSDDAVKLGKQVCGMEQSGYGKPWFIYSGGTPEDPFHQFVFMTTDGVTRSFRIPINDYAEDVWRLAVEVDLDAATVTGESGGAAAILNTTGLGGDWAPGLSLVDVGSIVMKFGGLGFDIAGWLDNFGPQGVKQTYYGARLSVPGTVPTTDAGRYGLGGGSNLLAALDLADPPTDARLVRCVTARPESSATYGLALLGRSHTHPYNAGTKVGLFDLDCKSVGPETYGYGAGIWCGGSIGGGYRFERCRFTGGSGFGGLMACACYPNLFRDCEFRGYTTDAVVMHFATVRFEGQTIIAYPKRNGMVFFRSSVDIASVFMSEAMMGCLTNISAFRGGRVVIRDALLDTEYNPAPVVAPIYMERSVSGDFPGSYLGLFTSVIDGGAEGVPLIFLDDDTTEAGFRAFLEMRGVQCWHPERGPTVRTNGPMWDGVVEGYLAKLGPVPAEPTREHIAEVDGGFPGTPGTFIGTIAWEAP